MTTFWCEHAVLADGVRRAVRVRVESGRVVSVTPDAPAGTPDVVLRGLVLPGLANAHSHAFHRVLRGRTHTGRGSFWTWREQMYDVARHLDPDRYLALARAVFAEMVLAGYTVVGEFHYLHHAPGGQRYAEPNAMGEALLEAARDAGLRLTLLDTLYLRGGLTTSGHVPLDEVQQRFSDGSVEAWSQRATAMADGPMARVGAAVHSVRAVPREDLAAVAAATAGSAAPLHVHLSEQPGENEACAAVHGCTPTALLDDAGLLRPTTTAVHATHLTDDDVARLGASGTAVAFCPTTERDLADGIGPARRLADAGVPIVLGSDQHAVVDPFEEVRGLEMHERLVSLERGRFTSAELVVAATADGYRSLGWPDGGVLTDGGLADLVAVRLDSPRTAGSDPAQALLTATSADVTDVVVGGEPVVTGGRHRLGDVGGLLAPAIAEVGR